ncbi:MAG: bifunctional demethylmenaquinone methyltransferase/2-methoxy-6-polyprenyl-1,4-benzoquinol methylase UbiE [Candidatus Symbiothrix sp.]|jgi:demethylmenaquinone methyltransferase/2-methoxy-6-polyprenyl-1,4-benzoquinol methylase|nr:bifunctional demethylmenaquinone methyltransferase/2-methoxy-6-polyprenyl-1,4-benzoquinol methylase UbiE [Candidatus Symbiothrix sp.]
MDYNIEKILPYVADNTSKSAQVEQMFDEIASQYDLLNHTLSLGIDKYWRKKGILTLKLLAPCQLLDVATGTGDLALEAYRLLKPEKIVGIDISEKMMNIGREKIAKAGLSDRIDFAWQNCSELQLSDNTFDAAIVAFGVRNFENLDKSLQEILRVLRPGGKLMILELSSPEYFPMKQGYRIYSTIIPLVGKWISRNTVAYQYLPKSIHAFPQNKEMVAILEKNGFVNVRYQKLSFGICTMYLGSKPANLS